VTRASAIVAAALVAACEPSSRAPQAARQSAPQPPVSSQAAASEPAPPSPSIAPVLAVDPPKLQGTASTRLAPVAPSGLCVTLGDVGRGAAAFARVDGPKVRAVTAGDPSEGELRFVYRGATDKTAALASGEVRSQLGLKLRAENGCNLLYVMWRFSPEPKLVVSTKSNPGKRLHAECGAHGYENLKPSKQAKLPAVEEGSEHTMHARLAGDVLTVDVDGRTVWEGMVPAGHVPEGGDVGFRTDNVRADVELRAFKREGRDAAPAPRVCAKGDE
jgi:hypothetical protein